MPTSGVESASNSSSSNAVSMSSGWPQLPVTSRKNSRAPGGAISRGRAGSSVPGQGGTGTGCCRGA